MTSPPRAAARSLAGDGLSATLAVASGPVLRAEQVQALLGLEQKRSQQQSPRKVQNVRTNLAASAGRHQPRPVVHTMANKPSPRTAAMRNGWMVEAACCLDDANKLQSWKLELEPAAHSRRLSSFLKEFTLAGSGFALASMKPPRGMRRCWKASLVREEGQLQARDGIMAVTPGAQEEGGQSPPLWQRESIMM